MRRIMYYHILTQGESDILYIFMANTHTAHVFEYFYGFKNFMWAFGLLIILPILKYENKTLQYENK